MIRFLLSLFGASAPRSPQWKSVQKRWLAAHPTCRACGGRKRVTAHHKHPYHLFPEEELDDGTNGRPCNLISLCEAHGCHLRVGHRYCWADYNPNVEADADAELAKYRRQA